MGTLRRDVTRAFAGLKKLLTTPIFGKQKLPEQKRAPKEVTARSPSWHPDLLFLFGGTSLRAYERISTAQPIVRTDTKLHYRHPGHPHAAARRSRRRKLETQAMVGTLRRRLRNKIRAQIEAQLAGLQ